jgi:hypothetical protein
MKWCLKYQSTSMAFDNQGNQVSAGDIVGSLVIHRRI